MFSVMPLISGLSVAHRIAFSILSLKAKVLYKAAGIASI
jgi:hypothetical protein